MHFLSALKNLRRNKPDRGEVDLLLSTSTAVIHLAITSQPEFAGAFGVARTVAEGQGLYYGIARDPNGHIWVGARCSMVSDARPSEAERGRLVRLTHPSDAPDFKYPVAPRPIRDLHDIACYNDTLWAVCSYDDAVSIYSFSHDSWIWWHPLPPTPPQEPDQYHFNSLYFEGDLVWVLAHQRGPSWLLAFPVAAALQGKTVAPVHQIELGQQSHNIWRQANGELCTCSSIEGKLVGEHGWQLQTGGFPRGVARLPWGWVVGISELKERSARDFSDAQLFFYDDAWQRIAEITLPKVGMVLDILPIPRSLTLPCVGQLPVVVN